MRLYKHLLLLLLFLAPLMASAQQYELMRVAKLDIVPENLSPEMAFNPSSVRARLHTKVGSLFSQIEFDNDLKMLANEYDRVEPRVEVINNEIHITLQIWFKPKIREINFAGNERFKANALLKKLEIEKGSLLERDGVAKAILKLRQLYVKKGYFEAEIDYDIAAVPDSNQVDLQINICEGKAGRIKDICFNGITDKEEDALLEDLLTKKYNFILSWVSNRGTYHPDMVEHDRLQVINFFQNRGYADVTVNFCVEEIPDTDKINLVINVDKGQPYSIGKLSLSGNVLFPDEKIWKTFVFGQGSVFSPEDIRNTVKAINDLYGSSGYIDSNVDFQVSLREDCPIYDISVVVEEGAQYYVGLIKVFGNCFTQTRVILNESLICPGEIFDNRKLEWTEARLANTGFFSAVNVYAVRSQIEDPCGARNYRDIYIEVEETDTGNLGLFGGFSSLDRLFVGIEISESNFNIAGFSNIFERGGNAIRGAGEFAHAKINLGDRQSSYTVQWTKPYIFDTPWIFGVDLEKSNNRGISDAYTIKTYGGDMHLTYILTPCLKSDLFYRARHSHTALRQKKKKNTELVRAGNERGFISAVGASLAYDSTDFPRRATRGLRARTLVELAGIGGNYDFVKLATINSYYYPLNRRTILKIRAEVQFIKCYGRTNPVVDEDKDQDRHSLPIGERLFLGGETTVRGYRSFILGPKFRGGEPKGGLSSYLITEELLFNLFKAPCIDSFVFVDAGFVSEKQFKVGKPSVSAGFGFRFDVMRNMPLMIGYGWPIYPIEKLEDGARINVAQRFFFALGGSF